MKMQTEVEKQSKIIDELVTIEVNKVASELDTYIHYVKTILDQYETQPISDRELEDVTLSVATLLYFVSAELERVGIREDIADSVKQNKYDDIFNRIEGTVAAKTSQARSETQQEQIVEAIYSRAYKIIKSKIANAERINDSCRKVLTGRIQQMVLSMKDGRK